MAPLDDEERRSRNRGGVRARALSAEAGGVRQESAAQSSGTLGTLGAGVAERFWDTKRQRLDKALKMDAAAKRRANPSGGLGSLLKEDWGKGGAHLSIYHSIHASLYLFMSKL